MKPKLPYSDLLESNDQWAAFESLTGDGGGHEGADFWGDGDGPGGRHGGEDEPLEGGAAGEGDVGLA